MNLLEVSSTRTDLRFGVSLDEVPSANLFVSGVVRSVGTANYAGRVTFHPDGGAIVHVLRNGSPVVGGIVQGMSVEAGESLNVAVQAEGTSPTVVRVKVWQAGEAEPSGWNYTLTDSTPGLQEAGSVGVGGYLSGAASNAPINVSFSDVWAGPTPGQ